MSKLGKSGGIELTEAIVENLANKAEHGHEPEHIRAVRRVHHHHLSVALAVGGSAISGSKVGRPEPLTHSHNMGDLRHEHVCGESFRV